MSCIVYLSFLLAFISPAFTATYSNPIVNENCPDPGAIHVAGRYYVATTTDHNDDGNKFPLRSSTDLVHWKEEGFIFPKGRIPRWAKQDFWAPEIHIINGNFIVYYVARDSTGMLCVGAAISKNVTGPFVDIGHPLIRNSTVGYIDPTYFYDEVNHSPYLVWKEDGNGRNPPEKYTPIWAIKLSRDGLSVTGDKQFILENDSNSWEGPLIEAPWVIKRNEYYYLFYSANGYAGPKYAVGVSRSRNLLGPYVKNPNNPIVHSDSHWSGPGHCSVILVPGTNQYVMIYHSWIGNDILGNYPRALMMDAIKWSNDDWPFVDNSTPSYGPTPVPN